MLPLVSNCNSLISNYTLKLQFNQCIMIKTFVGHDILLSSTLLSLIKIIWAVSVYLSSNNLSICFNTVIYETHPKEILLVISIIMETWNISARNHKKRLQKSIIYWFKVLPKLQKSYKQKLLHSSSKESKSILKTSLVALINSNIVQLISQLTWIAFLVVLSSF